MDCLTFAYSPAMLHTQETGVHFCKSSMIRQETLVRKQDLKISQYALMLPYFKGQGGNRMYHTQFTFVFLDWEVMRCDLHYEKGSATTDNSLLFVA